MTQIKCHIIPEPAEGTRVILRQHPDTKSVWFYGEDEGKGPDSYSCRKCDFILARDVFRDQIQMKIRTDGGRGIVLQCPDCKSFNELGPDIG